MRDLYWCLISGTVEVEHIISAKLQLKKKAEVRCQSQWISGFQNCENCEQLCESCTLSLYCCRVTIQIICDNNFYVIHYQILNVLMWPLLWLCPFSDLNGMLLVLLICVNLTELLWFGLAAPDICSCLSSSLSGRKFCSL